MSFKACKAVIGPLEFNIEENIITPYQKCRIICVNGSIQEITVYAFQATEARLFELWDADPTQFTKLEITQ